ncbi:hypothetical protein [Microlunatus flavus]|uniref:Uncharacterized protein n=1 Tax=Microlunatus flavus TaxID=1036181 RepID=A0A1H9CD98_9ACTN|nr:hypothetical protein [Microlunatus flavus]SEP98648.1 hypothetical protein SAMN05421756_102151 [Microlunatus flavus]
MTQEPRLEVEVHGTVGEPVTLPLVPPGDPALGWSLELPEELDLVDAGDAAQVRATQAGSYVVVATQSDAAGVAMTVLPVRVTVT